MMHLLVLPPRLADTLDSTVGVYIRTRSSQLGRDCSRCDIHDVPSPHGSRGLQASSRLPYLHARNPVPKRSARLLPAAAPLTPAARLLPSSSCFDCTVCFLQGHPGARGCSGAMSCFFASMCSSLTQHGAMSQIHWMHRGATWGPAMISGK